MNGWNCIVSHEPNEAWCHVSGVP